MSRGPGPADGRSGSEDSARSAALGAFSLLREHRPRSDYRDRPPPALDPNLPVLVLKIGRAPLAHIGVSIARSLGVAGAPVSAVVEDRFTPLALSRGVDTPVVWPTHGSEDPSRLLSHLVEIGERFGRRPLIVCSGDEAAVLVAEGRDRLAGHFVLPEVPESLPRQLASKVLMHELCEKYGVPAPRTRIASSRAELEAASAELGYPLVAKNTAPFSRLMPTALPATTRIDDEQDLDQLAGRQEEPFRLLLQEYLPNESSEDWFAHGYVAKDGTPLVFTGRKLRSGGRVFSHATALSCVAGNDELKAQTERFVQACGYRGVFDSDWRFDLRTGTFNLVDFNPRVGAQFRLFENDAGVDVVRALHLDLSGRPIPEGRVHDGDCLVVENLLLAGALDRSWSPTGGWASTKGQRSRPRGTWWMPADPLPAIALAARQVVASAKVRAPRPRGGPAKPPA